MGRKRGALPFVALWATIILVAATAEGIAVPARGTTTGPGPVSGGDSSLGHVEMSIPVGGSPMGIAYDPENGYVYVVNSGSNNVTVINGLTDALVASIPVGPAPWDVAYYGANQNVYVTEELNVSVAEISSRSNSVLATLPVGLAPIGIAADPIDGSLAVACAGSGNVTVVYGSTGLTVASISVNSPLNLAFDAVNDEIFVTSSVADVSGQNYVTVISGSSDDAVGYIPVGLPTNGIAYDPANGLVYATETLVSPVQGAPSFVAVMNATNETVVGDVTVGPTPQGVAFDPENDEIFVADPPSSLTVIDGSTNQVLGTLPMGLIPYDIAVDPVDGQLFVTNIESDNVTVVQGGTAPPSVGAPGGGGSGSSLPSWEVYAATGSGVLLAAVAVSVFVIFRRRRTEARAPPAAPEPEFVRREPPEW